MSVPSLNNLVATKKAAELVGYTPDYVAKLARDGEVLAEQRGRQWFVDLDSVKLFSIRAAAEQRRRQEKQRVERIEELSAREVSSHLAQAKTVLQEKRSIAMALSVVSIFCFLILAQLSFVVYSERVSSVAMLGSFSEIYASLKSNFIFWKSTEKDNTNSSINESEDVQHGIILLESDVSQAEINRIKNTFSDEVVVEPKEDGTGIIKPVFVGGESGESYQYVLVPLNKKSEVNQGIE